MASADPGALVADFKKFISDRPNLSRQDRRDIFDELEDYIQPNQHPFSSKIPPADVLIYAITDILRPDIEYEALPMLLDLLSSLEAQRKLALETAEKIVVFHDFYKNIGQLESSPQADHVEQLRQLTTMRRGSDALRDNYIYLIRNYCLTIIYKTWTAPYAGHDVVADTLVQLNALFPGLNTEFPLAASPRRFHADISDDERKLINDDGDDCYQFIDNSISWLQQQAPNGLTDADFSHLRASNEFTLAFPPSIDDDALVQHTEEYMQPVRQIIDCVQRNGR